jgi:predicted ATP-grasp superfamily ATP-dependent carboligase
LHGPSGGSALHAPKNPPALLELPGWNGTLAAARALGRRGIEIDVAGTERFSQARSSRFVRRALRCPPLADPERHLRWLLQLGEESPGLALYPSSDDTAFLYSAHQQQLSSRFALCLPPLEALHQLLDKSRLHQHTLRVGLRAPRTFFPGDGAEATRLADGASWPLLIKQRAQAFSNTYSKGAIVFEAGALERSYGAFAAGNRFPAPILSLWPQLDRPMVQEYLPEDVGRIYCLSGFLSPSGAFALRACLKVLSFPRYLGIGICFEHAEVDQATADRVLALFREVGYFGVFQCEFLEHQGERLLIDMNPRFYNFLEYDHARGLHQAWFAYLLSTGRRDELDAALAAAATMPPGAEQSFYCHRNELAVLLGIEWLFGRHHADRPRWREWLGRSAGLVDPVWAPDDPGPGRADLALRALAALRHPRSFFTSRLRKT